TAALQVDGEAQQTTCAPLWHCRDEFASIALGIPLVSIWIGPAGTRFRIQVVEDSLNHSGIEQQPFDTFALMGAAGVGGLTIDQETIIFDRYFGARTTGGCMNGLRRRQQSQGTKVTSTHDFLRYCRTLLAWASAMSRSASSCIRYRPRTMRS